MRCSSTPSVSVTTLTGKNIKTVQPLLGNYVAHGAGNHGRKVFHKVCETGESLYMYFWDLRDGATLSGWWIGESVGGTNVWALCNSQEATPPQTGWKVPWDAEAPEDGMLVVKPIAAAASDSASPSSGPRQRPCAGGHAMQAKAAHCRGFCDECGRGVSVGEPIAECTKCTPAVWRCSDCKGAGPAGQDKTDTRWELNGQATLSGTVAKPTSAPRPGMSMEVCRSPADRVVGRLWCNRGHLMQVLPKAYSAGVCDGCNQHLAQGDPIAECKRCSPVFWLCRDCHGLNGAATPSQASSKGGASSGIGKGAAKGGKAAPLAFASAAASATAAASRGAGGAPAPRPPPPPPPPSGGLAASQASLSVLAVVRQVHAATANFDMIAAKVERTYVDRLAAMGPLATSTGQRARKDLEMAARRLGIAGYDWEARIRELQEGQVNVSGEGAPGLPRGAPSTPPKSSIARPSSRPSAAAPLRAAPGAAAAAVWRWEAATQEEKMEEGEDQQAASAEEDEEEAQPLLKQARKRQKRPEDWQAFGRQGTAMGSRADGIAEEVDATLAEAPELVTAFTPVTARRAVAKAAFVAMRRARAGVEKEDAAASGTTVDMEKRKRSQDADQRREHTAALVVRKAIQRTRQATLETWEEIGAELERAHEDQAEAIGSLGDRIGEEVAQALEVLYSRFNC